MDSATYERLLPVFVLEAAQQLEVLGDAILVLSRQHDNSEARERVARAAHTIRGNAAALGLRQMMIEAQHLELWATRPANQLSPSVLSRLHETRQTLRHLLEEVATDSRPRAVS